MFVLMKGVVTRITIFLHISFDFFKYLLWGRAGLTRPGVKSSTVFETKRPSDNSMTCVKKSTHVALVVHLWTFGDSDKKLFLFVI